MKNRIELIEYFAEQGFTSGAEIGVCSGYFSEVICQKIPGVKLLVIDSWKERYKKEEMYKKTVDRLEPFKNVTIIRKTSMEAVKDVVDESLDFVFIDANHLYAYVKEDIEEWTKKVRINGIVSGHDYYVMKLNGGEVIKAVDEYVKKNNYKLKLTDKDKDNPIKDNRKPSWYFIKTK